MKNKINLLAGVLAVSVFFAGCSIGGKEIVVTSGVGSKDVFKIGGDSCNQTEAKVYLANYQNIYGKSYGIDLWEQGFQKKKLKQYVKEVALSEMTKIICMDLLAEDQEIALTTEEKARIKDAAAKYYESLNEAELTYTGASQSDIESMYEDYALANKVYQSLTQSVDEEVSDDEARIMEAMQIYVKTQDKAEEVSAKLAAGEDFAAVASNYNQKPVIEITFGRGDLPEEVEKAAFELDDGAVSDCIQTDDGFYFIKCINKFNEELTDANKSNIVDAREKAAFDDVYEEFVSTLASNLNESVWENIPLVTDGSISTDSFFEIIDMTID
ncbi:peptidyl-prolyl cis-trans isomerase [Roseburia sp. BX1005]|uniref:Peptidyl-prolyl cis-trans isomerase n=1 Tax=Roseburia zhanii TaxID=2763064 RepID=A0A923RUR9_9FIRM|nr:peptidyl-prolyl cis-trans isomerase [Roseburia zhanii]MBC5713514.1 peptidyl-prolyl cis-trans isomerase [Roseburia zhanii]